MPEIGVFFEEQFHFFQREDHLEQPKVLHKQNKGLESQSTLIGLIECLEMLPRLNVRIHVVIIDFLQTIFGLAQRNEEFCSIRLGFVVAKVLILLIVFAVLEDLLLLLFLGLMHGSSDHFLLYLLDNPIVIALHMHNNYISIQWRSLYDQNFYQNMQRIPPLRDSSIPKQLKLKKRKKNTIVKNTPSKCNQGQQIKVEVSGLGKKIAFYVPKYKPVMEVKMMIQEKIKTMRINADTIIGFQSEASNFTFDYRFQLGVGCLDTDVKLKCFHFDNQKGLEKYKICCCLAIGGFSKVFLVRSKISGKFFAAKFIDKSKQPLNNELLQNERDISLALSSPFLVKTHEFHETDQFFVFIMDYCPGGELFYLLKHIKFMTEDEARLCFIQVLLGIQHLHNTGFMYRDLKPENILLDSFGFLKIADFGLAKPHCDRSYSFCGSVQYMAPEILQRKGHQKLVDFYCLGALLYEMLIGHPPFYNSNSTPEQTKYKILNEQIQFPSQSISPLAKDLIIRLTKKNERERLGYFGGCKQIMAHPWVGKINRQMFEQKKFNPPFPVNLNILNFDPEEIGKSERLFEERINIAIASNSKNKVIQESDHNIVPVQKKKKSRSQLPNSKNSPYLNKSSVSFFQNKQRRSPYTSVLKKLRTIKLLKTEKSEQKNSSWIQKKFMKKTKWTEESQDCEKENKQMKFASKLKKKCKLVPFYQINKTESSPPHRIIPRRKNSDKSKATLPSFSNYLF